MTSKHTIVINGKVYDAVTGLPVAKPVAESQSSPVKKPSPSAPVKVKVSPNTKIAVKKPAVTTRQIASSKTAPTNHLKRSIQKSATLRRDIVKKPQTANTSHTVQVKPHTKHTSRQVAKSPLVSKFAPHPSPLHEKKNIHTTPVRPAVELAPIVARTHQKVAQTTTARQKSLMAERLSTVAEQHTPARKTPVHRRLFARRPRAASLMAASLAVMVLGGYLTYLSLPGLSVRVAASQAGIAASFPEYHPDGYRFSGPVAYAPGQVAITFHSNSNRNTYTVTQQKSTWDSQAVYDNVVAKASGDNYVTNSQNGLTIYTFKGQAAWVNKGILYTVNGTAPLNNEQLLHIAGSM